MAARKLKGRCSVADISKNVGRLPSPPTWKSMAFRFDVAALLLKAFFKKLVRPAFHCAEILSITKLSGGGNVLSYLVKR